MFFHAKHIAVLALVLVAVMACGGPSEADIEATVEARVQDRLEMQKAVEVAVEATVEAREKATEEDTGSTNKALTQTFATSTPIQTTTDDRGNILTNATSPVFSSTQLPDSIRSFVLEIEVEFSGGEYGAGTGIVFSNDGLTLTNYHVVAGARSIRVNGSLATLVDADVYLDLAVIRFDRLEVTPSTSTSTPPNFGTVADIQPGDEVYAIGYSSDFGNSVEVNKGKVLSIGSDGIRDVIWHDALLKPGFSGGALITSDGIIIGVNTAEGGVIFDPGFASQSEFPVIDYNFTTNSAVSIDEASLWIQGLENSSMARDVTLRSLTTNTTTTGNAVRALLEGDEVAWEGLLYKAIGHYTNSIQIDPEFAYAYVQRGFAYLKLDQYERAMEDFNEAIRLKPEFALAYMGRGIANALLNSSDGWVAQIFGSEELKLSLDDFNEAIRLEPKFIEVYLNRSITLSVLGKPGQAINDLETFANLDPLNPIAYATLGTEYLMIGAYKKAIDEFTKSIGLDPEFAYAYFLRGLAREQLGQDELATEDYLRNR